jgi:hypothetical protein
MLQIDSLLLTVFKSRKRVEMEILQVLGMVTLKVFLLELWWGSGKW